MGHSVIAVEPQDICLVRLHMSVLMNSFQNKITLVHNAVSSIAGLKVSFDNFDKQNLGATATKVESNNTKTIFGRTEVTITLNDLRQTLTTKRAIILMDIEGNECMAVQGGHEFLDEIFVPFFIMEWSLAHHLTYKKDPICSEQDTNKMVHYLTQKHFKPYSLTSPTHQKLDITKWKNWGVIDIVWINEKAKHVL